MDHTCGRREAVDEPGEQPEKLPNRLMMTTESKRPGVLPKRQKERNGEEGSGSKGEIEGKKATPGMLSSTSLQQPQPTQPSNSNSSSNAAAPVTVAQIVLEVCQDVDG